MNFVAERITGFKIGRVTPHPRAWIPGGALPLYDVRRRTRSRAGTGLLRRRHARAYPPPRRTCRRCLRRKRRLDLHGGPDRVTRPCRAVGIDVGSVNIKVCGLSDGAARAAVVAHEGDIEAALGTALRRPLARQAGCAAGDGDRRRRTASPGRHRRDRLERHRGGARGAGAPAARGRLPGRRGPGRLPPGRQRPRADHHCRQQVRVGHGRVLPPAARPHGPGPRGPRRGGRRRARAQALGALLGLHEVRLHAPPEQGRGHEGRHRAVALEGDGRQGRRVPDQGQDQRTARSCSSAASRGTAISSGSSRRRGPRRSSVVPGEATFFEAFGAAHLAPALGRPLAARQHLVRRVPARGRHAVRAAGVGGIARHVSPVAPGRAAPWRGVRARRRRRLDDDQGGAGRRRDRWRSPPRTTAARTAIPVAALQALPAPRCRRSSAARARASAWSPPRGRRASCSASSSRRPASTTRSSRTRPARRSSSRTSTRSSRSAARTPSTSCSTTACPSTTR